MSEKILVSVYRQDQERDLGILINKIKKESYSQVDLVEDVVNEFGVQIFYKSYPANPPYWKKFLKSSNLISPHSSILTEKRSINESFIFIIKNSNNTFFLTGGQGHVAIKDFIQDDFGMDILSRLITDDEHILRAVREKYIVGGILGSSKFFRKNYNILENEGFGKIYNELKASLDKKILNDYFGFSEEELNCVATSSFSFSKMINFEELFVIIKGCEEILKIPPKIIFNSVIRVVKDKNKDLITYLEKGLIEEIQTCNHYICHEDFEKYLSQAKKYKIFGNPDLEEVDFARIETLNDITEVLENKNGNIVKFFKNIREYSLISYDEENKELTKGKLFSHILGEYQLSDEELERINVFRVRNKERKIEGKNYFFIDGSWYYIKVKFIKDLNNSCGKYIKSECIDSIITKEWPGEEKTHSNGKNYISYDEGKYNESHIGEDDTIVLDRHLIKKTELCDILKWDDKNLYLCHVKKGFDQNMRDLTNQIHISASLLMQDKNNGYTSIHELYDSLKTKNQSSYFQKTREQTSDYSLDFFVNLFKDKKIIYILCFMDEGNRIILDKIKSETDPEDGIERYQIQDYDSNIAKFSLDQLIKNMKTTDFELKISQIKAA